MQIERIYVSEYAYNDRSMFESTNWVYCIIQYEAEINLEKKLHIS